MGLLWLGDASAVARAICTAPPTRWSWRLERLLAEARRARSHAARTGRAHPQWGDGSLMAVALRRRPPAEPPLGDRAFCACLAMVLLRLAAGEKRPTGF